MIIDVGMNKIQIWLNMTMQIYIYIGLDMYVSEYLETYLVVTVCFCYRSRERSQGEPRSRAELTVEHVPWETCAIA